MVTLYVGGKAVSWADAEKLFAEAARTQPVEFRDEAGQVIATSVPKAPPAADEPDWVKAITPDAIRQALEGPFMTLEEYRKQTEQP